MKVVKAKIKDGYSQWEEEFEIYEDAEKEIRGMIDSFNKGIGDRKKEKRVFVEVVDSKDEQKKYDWMAVLKDAGKFIYYVKRQHANPFGDRGVSEDYKKIVGAYSRFQRGIFGNFCSLVKEYSYHAYDDMTLLSSLTKDQYKKLREEYKKARDGEK